MPVSPRLSSMGDALPRRLPRRGQLACPPKRTDAKDGLTPRWAAENAARSLRPGAARYGGASYPAPLSLAAVVVPNAVRAAEPLSPPHLAAPFAKPHRHLTGHRSRCDKLPMLDHSGRESCLGAKRPNLSPFWALRLWLRGLLHAKKRPHKIQRSCGAVFLVQINTEDGSGRAAMSAPGILKTRYSVSIPKTVAGGCNLLACRRMSA